MASRQNPVNENDLQVQDRIYFINILRSKISELKLEMQRLQSEKNSFIENNKQYIVLNKTAKDLFQQTEDLRNEFEDYNMARMNSFCDVTELKKEIDDLHAHNQQLESMINDIYLEKQKKEERIEQLEDKLSGKKFQNEISLLESQINKIREQVSNSIIQQEALSLIDKISELEYHIEIEDDNEELEQTYQQYLIDIKTLQKTNLTLLSFISQTLINTELKVNSNDTLVILTEQYRKLKQDVFKLENLHQKLINELQELKLKYNKMQEDLIKFNNLEYLKYQAEKRKQQLIINKINIIKQKRITHLEIQTLQSQFETMQIQLQDNQMHQQIISLEKKLQSLLSIDEDISLNNEYEDIKHQALKLVYAHNQWLINQLKNSS